MNSLLSGTSTNIFIPSKTLRAGDLLEVALERVPYLTLRRNNNERRWDSEGLEWYRKIAVGLSDKLVVMRLQQRVCRQLAEVMLRGMLDVSGDSTAINSKAETLK